MAHQKIMKYLLQLTNSKLKEQDKIVTHFRCSSFYVVLNISSKYETLLIIAK